MPHHFQGIQKYTSLLHTIKINTYIISKYKYISIEHIVNIYINKRSLKYSKKISICIKVHSMYHSTHAQYMYYSNCDSF